MDQIVDRWRTGRQAGRRGRRALAWFLAVVATVYVVWLSGALLGLLPLNAGYVYRQWSSRPENLNGVSGWLQDWTFGTDLFYFRTGDRVYVAYDATIYDGALRLYIYDYPDPETPVIVSRTVRQSGAGRAEVIIPAGGLYRFAYYAQLDYGRKTGGLESFYRISWGLVR